MKAFCFINSETGYENDLMKNLKDSNLFDRVDLLFGAYDIVVELNGESEHVKNVLMYNVRKQDYVRQTQTLICQENE